MRNPSLLPPAVGCSDAGSGAPILLVHGSATTRRFWKGVAAALVREHRVLTVDLYGYGDSPAWPGERSLTPRDEGGLIRAAVERAGAPVHLVGHSYGGALTAEFAARHGELVQSLVLIEPSAFNLLQGPADAAIRAEIEDLALRHNELVVQRRCDEAAALFMTYWLGAAAWQAMPETRRAPIIAAMPKVAAEWRLIFLHLGGRAMFARLPMPTTMIYGGATRRPSRRIVEIVRSVLPQAALVEIAGAGHMLPLTHAEAVAAEIAEHVAGCDGTEMRAA